MPRCLLTGIIGLLWVTSAIADDDDVDEVETYVVHCEYYREFFYMDFTKSPVVPKRLCLVIGGETTTTLGRPFTIRATQLSPHNDPPVSASLAVTGTLSKNKDGQFVARIKGKSETHQPQIDEGSQPHRFFANASPRPILGQTLPFDSSSGNSLLNFDLGKTRYLSIKGEDETWLLTVGNQNEAGHTSKKWKYVLDNNRAEILRKRRTELGQRMMTSSAGTQVAKQPELESALFEFFRDTEINQDQIREALRDKTFDVRRADATKKNTPDKSRTAPCEAPTKKRTP